MKYFKLIILFIFLLNILGCNPAVKKQTIENIENWYKLYMKDIPVGYSHTTIEKTFLKNKPVYKYFSENYTKIKLMDLPVQMITMEVSYITMDLKPVKFYQKVKSPVIDQEIYAEMETEDVLKLDFVSVNKHIKKRYKIGKKTTFPAIADLKMISEKLEIGKRWEYSIFNFLNMKADTLTIQVVGKENLKINNQIIDCYLVEVNMVGLRTTAWVGVEDKKVYKATAPMDIQMVLSNKQDCENLITHIDNELVDLAYFVSLPSNKIIKNKEKIRKAKYSLSGDFKNLNLKSDYQKVIKYDKNYTVIEVEKPSLTKIKNKKLSNLQKLQYLSSDLYVQSNDKRIKRLSKKIIKDEKLDKFKVIKIINYLQKNIAKKPTSIIPSALEVLAIGQGDCNEFATLFAALARASGIPTKISAGLVYLNNKFFYHAWNEVFIGEWITVDPILNQFPADATHIKLIEGSAANQWKIANFIKNSRIEVLDIQ